jgi:hypothetical protein
MAKRLLRDHYLVVRMTIREREALYAAAAQDDLTSAELVREAVRRELRRRGVERMRADEAPE